MTEKKTESGSSQEYWQDVEDYAATALDPDHWSNEIDQSGRVHELVDVSEWVIYTWRNLKVLEHTAHFDAYKDHDCEDSTSLSSLPILSAGNPKNKEETSLGHILAVAAYHAMVADVYRTIEKGAS